MNKNGFTQSIAFRVLLPCAAVLAFSAAAVLAVAFGARRGFASILAALALGLSASSFIWLRHTVMAHVAAPIQLFTSAMEQYIDGDSAAPLNQPFVCGDLETLRQVFNRTLNQIERLKEAVNEEKHERQQAEFQHLQLQVNPHFFLNSLNIIFQLAQTRRYELIQDMAHCLVEYFRYMFHSNSDFVTLKAEIQHTRNYLRIQEMRFPHSLEYSVHVSDELLAVHVPPLVIQTFVENSIKYAVRMERLNKIRIDISDIVTRGADCLNIRVSDNGEGFPMDVLDKFYRDVNIPITNGSNIGLKNVRKRLQYLYGTHCHMAVGNYARSGGYVDITFPKS